MEKTPIIQRHVDRTGQEALRKSLLPPDHPIGELLRREAQVIGLEGSPYVRVPDGNGDWLTLEDGTKQLKDDPRFRDSIPNPTRVAKGDLDGVRDHFNDIVSGAAVVE